MRFKFLFITLLMLLMTPSWKVHSQEGTNSSFKQITIQDPTPGKALQGTILISASINVEGILSAEVSFSYAEDTRGTWFLIREIPELETNNVSTEWDTTVITDGEYTLRILIVTEEDQYVAYVNGLRVRNYTPIETSTPSPTYPPESVETLSPVENQVETSTQVSLTLTPLPPNPAQITTDDVTSSLGIGAALAVGALIILGIYQFLSNKGRRDE